MSNRHTKTTRREVNVRAIEKLQPGGWRLATVEEVSLIGTAPKDYVAYGDPFAADTVGFIAKKSRRAGDLECVTEEIISRIGRMLPLSIARSRLVRLPCRDQPDVRFMSRNFLRRGEQQLLHGAELVANYLDSSATEVSDVFRLEDRLEERRFYTVDFVLEVLHWWGRTVEERRSLQDAFGRMLAFDALVGAKDRHALNWGGVQSLRDDSAPRVFAPIYDTARGLFCEHRETRLVEIDAQRRRAEYITAYAMRSKPVFGCGRPGGEGANHFELVNYCLDQLDVALGAPIREIVRAFSIGTTERMLRRSFGRIITPRRIAWILELLQVRCTRLKMLMERPG